MFMTVKKFVKRAYHYLSRRKIYIASSADVSLDTTLSPHVKVFSEAKIGGCHIGPYSYVGQRCHFARTTIGPFCSIGPEVLCGLGAHPTHFVSTYPGFYSRAAGGATFFGTQHEYARHDKQGVAIGADVWIGARATIVGGITIGHGAVIAAGAMVTKDVPPYAIVGGVPAKLIRYRFETTVIDQLTESRWWEMPEEALRALSAYAHDPSLFLNQLRRQPTLLSYEV